MTLEIRFKIIYSVLKKVYPTEGKRKNILKMRKLCTLEDDFFFVKFKRKSYSLHENSA